MIWALIGFKETNHCLVARYIIGLCVLQSCGYWCLINLRANNKLLVSKYLPTSGLASS